MTNNPPIDALEPCPFCGGCDVGEGEFKSGDYFTMFLRCRDCEATAPHEQWNTRAAIQSLPNGDKINVQELCDIVLKAAGSGFQHYMPSSKDRIIRDATNYLNGAMND